MPLATGARLGPYEIQSLIGAGGMGEVYRGRDTRLDRTVAIKVLPPAVGADPDRRARFEREAKTIAGLNHPHVCTLYDVGDHDGATFLVMEHIEGQTLARRLLDGPLPLDQAIAMAIAIADGLAAAHRRGLIHRDLKPANIMVTPDGQVKVLDFGLAKHVGPPAELRPEAPTMSAPPGERSLTHVGVTIGTLQYMSPEQVEGEPLDARTDVFSFGVVLYEMLTGKRAFQGNSPASTMSAILRDAPMPLPQARPDTPQALDRILGRCLEKKRDLRYDSAVDLHDALVACQSQLAARALGIWGLLRKPRVAIPALALVTVVLAAASWSAWRSSRVNWARTVALPQIRQLVDEGRTCAAFRLVGQVEQHLPSDPEIEQLRRNFMRRMSFRSDPPGADVNLRDYIDTAADAPWDHVGRTPLDAVLIPAGHLRYRISRPGFTTVEGYTASAITGAVAVLSVTLPAERSAPSRMVRVPAQPPLDAFWLDKYEVTNRRFKEFVLRGGYEKAGPWKVPFIKDGRTIGWDRAMAEFRDATGRPGPATWQFGTYPEGQDDYPVGGLSWYEAAAYCASDGKVLPTVHHWRSAAQQGTFTTILQMSNFAGRGPAAVGSYGGLGPFGTYDAAGNVREWCLNASGDKRFILGGAWNDPKYLFQLSDARPPFDRASGNGVRCARYETEPSRSLTDPGEASLVVSSRSGDTPVGDEIYEVYKAIHVYDRGELDATIEATDDSSPYWREQKVSFVAAYGHERVTAYLFIPRNADRPFQTVVTFPGVYAFDIQSSARLETQWFDFIVRSGRAVVHPIYKGMYERSGGGSYAAYVAQPGAWRELSLDWYKDLGRTLDYLEARPEFDREKMAYQGISLGAAQGPRLMALEPRLKTGVLFWGGFLYGASAEVNSLHFAPRCTAPVLMVNGRSDPMFPEETSQLPMFRLLGAPEKDKRRVVVDAGHVAFNREVIREVLGWLDKYLGPVRTR
jgi:formylglycine-generating enzyme required for sulfatase activity/dienelactone hydrolase